MLEARLDKIIHVSKSILDELQSGRKLSDILPQARFIAEINNDPTEAAWIEYEIHGKLRAPVSAEPKLSIEQGEAAAQIYDELHRTIDFNELSEILIAGGDPDSLYSLSLCQSNESIIQLEHFAISEHEELGKHIYEAVNVEDKVKISMALESERLLAAVRNTVHRYVSKVWITAVQEKENLDLIGPDYKIVIDNLEALETGVGQELRAALGNLRQNNQANWKLAALGCRNVIIKLGDILWNTPDKTYFSELAEGELDLVGEKEKNKLYAYIDYHHKRSEEQEQKDTLKYIHSKLWGIYEIGSKGKRTVRHKEAQNVIVDTFEFVAKLAEITGLQPVEEI